MGDILWGAGGLFALSFLITLFDRETRGDLGEILRAVIGLPVYVAVLAGLRITRRWPKAIKLSPSSLRRFASFVDKDGVAVFRERKAVLILRDPEQKGGN